MNLTCDIRALPERWQAQICCEPETDCWMWTGELTPNGYARLHGGMAHLIIWDFFGGQQFPRSRLHHGCRRKSCVNPAHLRPLTQKEHSQQHKTGFCKSGLHRLEGDNLIAYDRQGHTGCRACRRISHARWQKMDYKRNSDWYKERDRKYYQKNRERLIQKERERQCAKRREKVIT